VNYPFMELGIEGIVQRKPRSIEINLNR
jgi:hypothetical protein